MTPAPTAYQNNPVETRKKKEEVKERCTFGMKTLRFFNPNKNPGPGTHNPEFVATSGLFFSVGKGSRSNQVLPIYTDRFYDVQNIFPGGKIGFGSEKKQKEMKKSRFPGPGTYNISGLLGDLPAYASKIMPQP